MTTMKRFAGLAGVLLACTVAVGVGTLYVQGSADSAAQDRQPIDFSHQLHSGDLKIACLFCHRAATQSAAAGIPPMQICMTCHRAIDSLSPEIHKLQAAWQAQRPVQWVRLQHLPDFVYFTHEMHLHAGLRCADCHGRVETMSFTPRAATYEMGWCLTCHRQHDAPRDCWTCHK